MSRAVILMATYNGEKYIREQLDSIIAQTYTDWDLYVSDDMSKDSTVDILKEYEAKDARIKSVIKNEGIHGAFANFFSLIDYMKKHHLDDYDYFFYSDQDDIWLENKLEVEIAALDKYNVPALVYSDMRIMDAEGNVLSGNMSDTTCMKSDCIYDYFFKHHYVWGNVMGHNKALWNRIILPENEWRNAISHDTWLVKLALICGNVEYLEIATIIYRRHNLNVSNLPVEHNVIKTKSLRRFLGYYIYVCKATRYFFERQYTEFNDFKNDYLDAVNKGGLKVLKFFKKYDIKVTEGWFSTFLFKLLFMSRLPVKYYDIKAKLKGKR